MQAILTKFLPATNHRSDRVKAYCACSQIVVAWDHSLNIADNHKAAALALIAKLAWEDGDKLVQGGLPDLSGYAFVFPEGGN